MAKALFIDDSLEQQALYLHWFSIDFAEVEWFSTFPPPPDDELQGYSAILVDYRMPALSGIDLAMELKEKFPNKYVAMITTYEKNEIPEPVPQELDYYSKFDLEKLTDSLRAKFKELGII